MGASLVGKWARRWWVNGRVVLAVALSTIVHAYMKGSACLQLLLTCPSAWTGWAFGRPQGAVVGLRVRQLPCVRHEDEQREQDERGRRRKGGNRPRVRLLEGADEEWV